MALELVESLIDSTISYIETNQADKWADVESRYTDRPIPLDDFGTISIGDPSRPQGGAGDALFVVADQATASGEGVTALFQPVYQIEFAILCLGETEELAKRKTWRRLVGLCEMLKAMGPSDGLEWGTGGPVTTYYLPTYTRGEMELVSDARLIVSVYRPEGW